ncbi:PREDICTED: glutathione S-transferase T3-like [Camelina sativa]|uniref:Glutathione S-transferase T3-like n=1 Tax=Camelina sativa TaxID=90675 RepID=A0ABM0SKQ3_CAMSA|nr:PREDICTED: glutathione S-transferase T3-like [Camelina sativa]
MLVSALLITSKDTVTSNEQRCGDFWRRIADYFATCPNGAGRPKREASYCKQRWGKISEMVCKFVVCYEAATRENCIGKIEDDVMKLADHIFFNDHKQKFTLEHSWRELRYDHKWCASTSTKENGVKRGRVCGDGSAQDAQLVIDVEDEPMPRPPGVKAVKGKAKKSSNTKLDVEADGKAFLEFQMERVERMYEMNQKDIA